MSLLHHNKDVKNDIIIARNEPKRLPVQFLD